MVYSAFRSLMFRCDPESVHDRTLAFLRLIPIKQLSRLLFAQVSGTPKHVMGLTFPNPVGLAAGLDKNGECVNVWQALGFGFVEIGTVTPRPQPGNPRPRLFRIPQARALINRMGFNNKGVDYLIEQVQRSDFEGVLGINIGKNADTPAEHAIDDYLIGLQRVYAHASYVTINISSPNTRGLRDLQYGAALDQLLERLKTEQSRLAAEYGRYVPLAVKIAPDIAEDDVPKMGQTLLRHGIDGVIATNTTFSRVGVEGLAHADETGGLSGAPLMERSTAVVRQLRSIVGDHFPIIAAGGILSGADAAGKIDAGADLVQIYSGFIYRGPELIREAILALHCEPGIGDK